MYVGVLWPLEGMPTVLRYLGSVLPMTYPAQAMRAAMGRGRHVRERGGIGVG